MFVTFLVFKQNHVFRLPKTMFCIAKIKIHTLGLITLYLHSDDHFFYLNNVFSIATYLLWLTLVDLRVETVHVILILNIVYMTIKAQCCVDMVSRARV